MNRSIDSSAFARALDPRAWSTRGVWPAGVASGYLLAGTDRGRRTVRIDRVVEAEFTGGRFEQPAVLELAAAWEAVVEEVEQRRARTAATVLIDARLAPHVEARFGRHSRRTKPRMAVCAWRSARASGW